MGDLTDRYIEVSRWRVEDAPGASAYLSKADSEQEADDDE